MNGIVNMNGICMRRVLLHRHVCVAINSVGTSTGIGIGTGTSTGTCSNPGIRSRIVINIAMAITMGNFIDIYIDVDIAVTSINRWRRQRPKREYRV